MKKQTMLKLLEPIDHYFVEGVESIEIEPQLLSLKLDESQKNEIKNWEKFMVSKNTPVPARDKVALATMMPWNTESGTLRVSAFPLEYKYVIAAVDSPVKYYGQKKPPKLEGLDVYALSVSGISRVTGHPDIKSGILFGVRPEIRDFERAEERLDTVWSAVMQRGDVKRGKKKGQDPFIYRFMEEAGKNSIQSDPFSIRKYGVIRSDGWNNIIQCFDTIVPMESIQEYYKTQKQEWGLRLERKAPKSSKYTYLFICPEERLGDYAHRNRGKLSDRTRCILSEYLGRTLR